MQPILRLAKATLGADLLIAFRWITPDTASTIYAFPHDPELTTFTLERARVEEALGFLLEVTQPRELLSTAVLTRLAAPPVAVLAVSTGDQPDALGVLAIWLRSHAPPQGLLRAASEIRAALIEGLGSERVTSRDAFAARLEAVAEAVPEGLVIVDDRAGSGYVNGPAAELLGVTAGEVASVTLADAMRGLRARAANRDEIAARASTLFATPGFRVADWIWSFEEPVPRELSVTSAPVRGASVTGRIWMFSDVTERRAVEEQLRQAKKMEAVAKLAGGMAHDFNNMLMVVRGGAELILLDLPPGDPQRAGVEDIWRASDRATQLTQQLLAFSRRQVLHLARHDLNALVEEMRPAIAAVAGAHVQLACSVDPAPAVIAADAGRLGQVLLELARNAVDAMPTGGALSIAVGRAELAAPRRHRHGVIGAGSFITLTVRDSGAGMGEKTLEHLFEPFFTTKPPGKGAGLGLATLYGFLQQLGADVEVESAPGAGSTFTVYFPRASEEPMPAPPPAAPVKAGPRTVLVVDDERAVRMITARILGRLGYRVLHADNGPAALALLAEHRAALPDLVISDVMMEGMSGRELGDRIAVEFPGMKVLYVSGYSADDLSRDGVLDGSRPLLQKPFTLRSLEAALSALLAGPLPPS